MNHVQGFLYLAFDAAAVLLLVATWQRTRIHGFLFVAASYVLGILARWFVPLLHRTVPADGLSEMVLIAALRSIWFLISAVAIYGFWDIYRRLRRPPPAAPPAA